MFSDPLLEKLLQRKLLFVTGKGGVGKSFVSRCLAWRAAAAGKKVLLMEVSDESQHQSYLGIQNQKHEIQYVAENFYHINIVYEYNFRDYIVKYLGMEGVFNQVFKQGLVKSLLRTVPGLNEITFLGRLYYECEVRKDDPFDLIILDAFSSGHFLKLLTTPEGIIKSGLVGPVLNESKNIINFLGKSKDVGLLYVSLPEALVTDEVKEFVALVQAKTKLSPTAVLVNNCLRMEPEFLSEAALPLALFEHLSYKLEAQKACFADLQQSLSQEMLLKAYMTPPFPLHYNNQNMQDIWKYFALEVLS